MLAVTIDVGTIGGFLGIAAVLGAAAMVFRSADAKATIELQAKRIDALEDAEGDCTKQPDKAFAELEVLRENVTNAGAIARLTEAVTQALHDMRESLDDNRRDHAVVAQIIGQLGRPADARTRADDR